MQTQPIYQMNSDISIDKIIRGYYDYSFSTLILLFDLIEKHNYLDPKLSEQFGVSVLRVLNQSNLNEKNTIHNRITDLMYKGIDFHPHFVIRYLREYDEMIPSVMI